MPVSNRRDFLQGSFVVAGAIGGGAALSMSDESSTPHPKHNSARPLRLAVLGGSTETTEMVRGLAGRHACLVSHFWSGHNTRPTRLLTQAGRTQKQAIRIESDLGKILSDPAIDAVAIAVPSPSRTTLACAALEAGKDVLLAVPCATSDEAVRIDELAADHNKICATHLPWRNNVGLRQAMQYLHSGKPGEVRRIHALAVGRGECTRLIFPIDLALWANPSLDSFQFTSERWTPTDNQGPGAMVGMFTGNGPPILLEARPSGKPCDGVKVGVVIHTTRGKLVFPNAESAIAFGPDGAIQRVFQGTGDPYAGFVRAVRTRDVGHLAVSPGQGYRTGFACRLLTLPQVNPSTPQPDWAKAATVRVRQSVALMGSTV